MEWHWSWGVLEEGCGGDGGGGDSFIVGSCVSFLGSVIVASLLAIELLVSYLESGI